MSVTVLRVAQRTPAWHLARLGRLTGSRARDMRARRPSGEAVSRRTLRQQLVAERLTGRVVVGGCTTAAMRRGVALEPAALAAYEAATGRLVHRTGFLADTEQLIGCSLDGHVGDLEGIVEVKCRASWAHLDALAGGAVPAADLAQVTHNLLVSGAAWCDVVSYDDRFGPTLRIAITRVARAAVAIDTYAAEVRTFLAEVARDVAAARGVAA